MTHQLVIYVTLLPVKIERLRARCLLISGQQSDAARSAERIDVFGNNDWDPRQMSIESSICMLLVVSLELIDATGQALGRLQEWTAFD